MYDAEREIDASNVLEVSAEVITGLHPFAVSEPSAIEVRTCTQKELAKLREADLSSRSDMMLIKRLTWLCLSKEVKVSGSRHSLAEKSQVVEHPIVTFGITPYECLNGVSDESDRGVFELPCETSPRYER